MTDPRTNALPASLPPLPYAPPPAGRLADRLIDEGALVAQAFVDEDRLDPARPSLGLLVAEALAAVEQRTEERLRAETGDTALRDRIVALIAQREQLRDERLGVARRFLDEHNLPPAAAELSWASTLDEQLGALRLLLADGPTQ